MAGSNIGDIHSVGDALALIWNQTWPLFTVQHLPKMLLLFTMSFILYSVSYGLIMW